MSFGATDLLRSLFLKGFKLSKQGNYEDPTYLGFKIVVDFGALPVRADDGLPPSPLFRETSYINNDFSVTILLVKPSIRTELSLTETYHFIQQYLI